MSLDLLSLITGFESADDRESEVAWFKTLVPWIGPEAYLNIVYKPAERGLLQRVAENLKFPAVFIDFLSQQNGAMLFSGALNLYGVVQPDQFLNRSDRFSLPPFNIQRENDSWSFDKDRLLVIGGYRSDGSRVCLDRVSSSVVVFKKPELVPIPSRRGLEDWLLDEVTRLSTLFDSRGKRISR
jgi:hypothetical protein